jgi:hypothetical protein
MRRLAAALRDPAELEDEVHVPGVTAELAVGGVLEADVVLELDRVADRVVLDRPERRRRRSSRP